MTRKRSVWVLLTAVTSLLVAALGVQPAGGVAVPTPESGAWSGYATGSALHINALQTSATAVTADTSVAFSGSSVNSQTQANGIVNEMGLTVQPANAEREAYGRGSGAEVGTQRTVPITNTNFLPALAEASPHPPAPAGPNPYQTELVTRDQVNQSVGGALYASVLRGQAAATWNDQWVMPMLGHPLGFGLGYADDTQLQAPGASPTAPGGGFNAPLVALDTGALSGQRAVSQSLSTNYLVNNGDGTCGLASETRITVAPIRLNTQANTNPADDVTIEVLGEIILRAFASGKPGGSSLTFRPANETRSPLDPIIRVIQGNTVTQQLTTQQLFQDAGLVIQQLPVISVAVGEDPRAIAPQPTANPDAASRPTITDTEVSAAVDIARVRLLPTTAPNPGLTVLDLRLGHFEVKASVPEGGINCEIPVLKTVDKDPVMAGEDMTFTIAIPRDAGALIPFPCELTNIRVVDTVQIEEGEPRFQVIGGTGPNGEEGVVDGDTITFENIGSYKVGDPPLLVQVVVRILPDSGVGRLKDTVKVEATPAGCKATNEAIGRALGAGFFGAGGARLTGAGLEGAGGGKVTGTGELGAPEVVPAPVLPKTGGPLLPIAAVAAGGLAVLLGIRQSSRRRSEG